MLVKIESLPWKTAGGLLISIVSLLEMLPKSLTFMELSRVLQLTSLPAEKTFVVMQRKNHLFMSVIPKMEIS